jgi:hypothetical protein
MVNMLNAFVFLNCDSWTDTAIVSEISDMSGVSEAVRVSGAYDIAKLVKKIRAIADIRSSLTMIVSEGQHPMKQIEVA